MWIREIVSLGVLVTCLSACNGKPPPEPRRIDEVRHNPPAFKVTSYTLQRRDLQGALGRVSENTIRLVPVYQNVASYQSWEYRVFDLRPKGVYSLLGLENSDIIVAADGFLIKKPEQFLAYVQLLSNENEGTIEIKRGAEARLLKYSFVPAVEKKPTIQPTPQRQ